MSPLLQGISSATVDTARLRTHVLTSGDAGGPLVLFIHGNLSSGRFWEETMLALPPRFHAVAADLRGFGDSEPKPIDATRGVRDFSDDLHALVARLEPAGGAVHLVGWSVGGAVAMQYAINHPTEVASITLVAPMSPYGFGGTRDARGTPCWPDYAGSGGGTANAEVVKLIEARDTGEASPFSPRNLMNQFYFKPPFRAPRDREDVYVDSILATRTGDDLYPGNLLSSPNWPCVAPGTRGMNNAISAKYCDVSAFSAIPRRPDVLWIRGADDQIVSDTSLFDLGYLGQLGAVPGWPGAEVYPAQPMIAQLRATLDAYQARGGRYREEVLPGVGHSPHIEAPDTFRQLFNAFLEGR
jgi:pimeloyl-ACP methyl ester carboxylesterase